ncbi:hypothetical protein D3C80_1456210 [compost metagenome]
MLAMVANDNACSLTPHVALTIIASTRASTGCSYKGGLISLTEQHDRGELATGRRSRLIGWHGRLRARCGAGPGGAPFASESDIRHPFDPASSPHFCAQRIENRRPV